MSSLFSPARRQPKELPGNRPQTVAQAPDGSINLAASTAAIYGPSLTFEQEFGNLGNWNDATDHATWTFHVDRPATFTVSINWACAEMRPAMRFESASTTRSFIA